MRSIYKLLCLAAIGLPVTLQAQLVVDRTKYPDYDPSVNPDKTLLRYGSRHRLKSSSLPAVSQRPDHVNNAASMYFPPIISQEGGSCGSASRIAYMFTHELNAFRHTDASLPENMYPTHFVWLLTYGNSGKDEFVQHVGVPSVKTYGGRGNSALFGYKEWDSTDFGWMTGYEKWHEAMFNRMLKPSHLPMSVETEEGRDLLKNWLWNHNGDTDFAVGGIAGIGVAASVTQAGIPKTDANVAAGVVGQSYVKWWGETVNHALTIVGYDDRIEFDLDGNGKAGEKDKDEVGAWIIANSWGGWANNGLIYCPYAYGFPAHSVKTIGGKKVHQQSGGWWQPELYNVRKNYRPLRTIKVKMDYSRRSEMLLTVGVASDLKATRPERTIDLHHFRWAGDGHNGDLNPAPEIPMLGRWADGKLHTEPMEFGYDLTDLCDGFDHSRPLKFFFNVDARTKSGNAANAKGSGHIYSASIIDYEFDQKGVETPLDLGGSVVNVPGGKVTTVSGIVYGEQYTAPLNLTLKDNKLVWMAPQNTGHTVRAYNIYKDGTKLGETAEHTYAISGEGAYSVSAVFESGIESQKTSVNTPVAAQTQNMAVDFHNNGFVIPDVFNEHFDNCTIEFWIKPNSVKNWNNQGGPGWGKFMCHANADGTYTAGWDAVGEKRANASGALKIGKWSHIAMVVSKTNFRLFVNGRLQNSVSGSPNYSGLGGFGNLVFASGGSGQDATYDEIRIWNRARTAYELQSALNADFSGATMPNGLLAYYKGDVVTIDGKPYLRDCVGGHHAEIALTSAGTYEEVTNTQSLSAATGKLTINNTLVQGPAQIEVGQPAVFTASYPDVTTSLTWNAPQGGITDYSGTQATAVFSQSGTFEVALTARNAKTNEEITVKKSIAVTAAPACDATFTASMSEVPAGQRISFIPTHPVPGFSYHWEFPGGDVASSNAISAATSYNAVGTYTVKLTVTSPAGETKSSTQKVNVVEVTPEAAFDVLTPVVLKGKTVKVKDESKYAPTAWQWLLTGSSQNILVKGHHVEYKATEPGVFDVSLTASNSKGANTATRSRGLIVVNADSQHGLSFNNAGARVRLAQIPLTKGTKEFTVEWWMNPSKLSNFCCGIGESDATFQIKVDASGAMLINESGRQFKSNPDVVVAGEWHHYAVVVRNSQVLLYRDGEKQAGSGSLPAMGLPQLSDFTIGTNSADMSGQIDEFRIWNTALKLDYLKEVSNQPIDVSAQEVKDNKLLVYYDFNQNSGDVQDRGTTSNTGRRVGFGPDGDAWPLSSGVFCLNFTAKGMENVTNTYLANTKSPFLHTNKSMNTSQSGRWYELKNWLQENAVTESGVTSGATFDKSKNNDFAVTSGWDGFADLKDHKVFQTVKLPAGSYAFTITYGQHAESSGCYLVAAAGETLPNTADLSQAIAYVQMEGKANGGNNTLYFTLDKETEVSLGLLSNMSGQRIFTIHGFLLSRGEVTFINGVDHITSVTLPTTKTKVGSAIYDLTGRKVEKMESGSVYIQNGKRILVK